MGGFAGTASGDLPGSWFAVVEYTPLSPGATITGGRNGHRDVQCVWPGPFSPQRDKFGRYIGYLSAQFSVGITTLNRLEIDRFLVLN